MDENDRRRFQADYRVGQYIDTLTNLTGYIAVTRPLWGDVDLRRSAIVSRVQQIQMELAKRAEFLQDIGMLNTEDERFVRRCPPTVVIVRPSRRRCGHPLLCPWCWNRNVVAPAFVRFSRALFDCDEPREGYKAKKVLDWYDTRETEIIIRHQRPIAEICSDEKIGLGVEAAKYRRAVGLYQLTTIEPTTTGDWKVIRRTAALLHPTCEVEGLTDFEDMGNRQYRVRGPLEAEDLPSLIGCVCAYPVGMLRGDVKLLPEYFAARSGPRGQTIRLARWKGLLRFRKGD